MNDACCLRDRALEKLSERNRRMAGEKRGEYARISPRRAEGASMSEKEGTLRMMASGRWAVYRPGRLPVEITSGELFRVEVAGELKLTRMEYNHTDRQYYSVDGY